MRNKTMDLKLPEDCWESVFKFVIDDKDCLKSLSAVSKQFLSITNRLRYSLTINYPTRLLLRRLFRRFPNLTTLDFSSYHGGDLDAVLREISRFPLKLTSLNLSQQLTIPVNALRDFSQHITTITSLNFHDTIDIDSSHLIFIADCFPLLEELDLGSYSKYNDEGEEIFTDQNNFRQGLETISLKLSKLRKINLSNHTYVDENIIIQLLKNNKFLEEAILFDSDGVSKNLISSAFHDRPTLRFLSISNFDGSSFNLRYIDSLLSLKCLTCLELIGVAFRDEFLCSISMKEHHLMRVVIRGCHGYGYSYVGIFCLLYKCRSIRHLDLSDTKFLNDQNVAELSWFLGDLVSVNLSGCKLLTDAALFQLVRNCPSLSDIDMGSMSIETDLMDFVANPQLNSLKLAYNTYLRNKEIMKFAFVFPNLELLDLSKCDYISERGIGPVLKRCCNIKHLNLASCIRVRQLGINFEVPKLEVLDLSKTPIDDEILYEISKSCHGLLRLILMSCVGVTSEGVEHVVKNCTQLREINLKYCSRVDDSVVASMIFSRPSLRKIVAPPKFHLSDKERKHFLCRGCHVELH